MPVRIVRLGQTGYADEDIRLGTVRRPPRGVPKSQFATRDFYALWLPELSPSAALTLGQSDLVIARRGLADSLASTIVQ